jgi:hypothetical protein
MMHTLNEFKDAVETGIVALKEIVDGTPRYRFVTSESKLLTHFNMSFNEGAGDQVETDHEQGTYAAIDILSGEALQLEMRYFRGVCAQTAYSVHPETLDIRFVQSADFDSVFNQNTVNRFSAGENLNSLNMELVLAEGDQCQIVQTLEVPDNESARLVAIILNKDNFHTESVKIPLEALQVMISESTEEDAIGMTVALNDDAHTEITLELAVAQMDTPELHEDERQCNQRVQGFMNLDTAKGAYFSKDKKADAELSLACDLIEVTDANNNTEHLFFLTKEA